MARQEVGAPVRQEAALGWEEVGAARRQEMRVPVW